MLWKNCVRNKYSFPSDLKIKNSFKFRTFINYVFGERRRDLENEMFRGECWVTEPLAKEHILLTLKALQFRYFLTRLVSDSLVKYHGLVLSSGQTLQGEQITQRSVCMCGYWWGRGHITHYTGENKCNLAHESHRGRVLIIVSVRLEHSLHSGRQK